MFAASINTVFSEKVSLKEGEFAPDFSLEDQDGKVHSLSAYKGQRVILYFFPYADTPGWIKEACGFRNIYQEFIKNNLVVMGVSYNKAQDLRKFKDKYNLPFNFLSDRRKNVTKNYGAKGLLTPKRMTYIINENSRIEKIYRKVNINTHAETILQDILK